MADTTRPQLLLLCLIRCCEKNFQAQFLSRVGDFLLSPLPIPSGMEVGTVLGIKKLLSFRLLVFRLRPATFFLTQSSSLVALTVRKAKYTLTIFSIRGVCEWCTHDPCRRTDSRSPPQPHLPAGTDYLNTESPPAGYSSPPAPVLLGHSDLPALQVLDSVDVDK